MFGKAERPILREVSRQLDGNRLVKHRVDGRYDGFWAAEVR
jgi:hypothetical protein